MKMKAKKPSIPTVEEELLQLEKHIEQLYAKHRQGKPVVVSDETISQYAQDYSLDDGIDIDSEEEALEDLNLLLRNAAKYRRIEYFGPEEERKTCVWPGGESTSWAELSSGYSWVGVKGTDTTCVVSICNPLRKRPAGKVQLCSETVLTVALADMLGDTTYSIHRKIPQSSHAGPVAVVSVAPCLRGHECQQASRAINFLKKKLKHCSSLSAKETEEIAICTLMYLLGRKFNPKKIEIYGFGKYKGAMGRMRKKHVMRALKQTTTIDLTNMASSISLSSTSGV